MDVDTSQHGSDRTHDVRESTTHRYKQQSRRVARRNRGERMNGRMYEREHAEDCVLAYCDGCMLVSFGRCIEWGDGAIGYMPKQEQAFS